MNKGIVGSGGRVIDGSVIVGSFNASDMPGMLGSLNVGIAGRGGSVIDGNVIVGRLNEQSDIRCRSSPRC